MIDGAISICIQLVVSEIVIAIFFEGVVAARNAPIVSIQCSIHF